MSIQSLFAFHEEVREIPAAAKRFIVLEESSHSPPRHWCFIPNPPPKGMESTIAAAWTFLLQYPLLPVGSKIFTAEQIDTIVARSEGKIRIGGRKGIRANGALDDTIKIPKGYSAPSAEEIAIVGAHFQISDLATRHAELVALHAASPNSRIPSSKLFISSLRCIRTERHAHGDRNPSASLDVLRLNLQCFTCNTKLYRRHLISRLTRPT